MLALVLVARVSPGTAAVVKPPKEAPAPVAPKFPYKEKTAPQRVARTVGDDDSGYPPPPPGEEDGHYDEYGRWISAWNEHPIDSQFLYTG